MDPTAAATTNEEHEWASIELSELFCTHYDAANYLFKLARGLPPAGPLQFPSVSLTAGLQLPEAEQECVVDVYFTPDATQMASEMDAITLDITRCTRALHTPYQLILERRLAVLSRVYTAAANIYADTDTMSLTKMQSENLRWVSYMQFDAHPNEVPDSESTPPEPLSLTMRSCLNMLLLMLTTMSRTNISLASDIIHKLSKGLEPLPALSLTEIGDGVGSKLAPLATDISKLLSGLLLSIPSHTRLILEVWLKFGVLRGSLGDLLEIVIFLLKDNTQSLVVGPLLRELHGKEPVPYLGAPAPQTWLDGTKLTLPPDVASPLLSSVVVDTAGGWCIIVLHKYGLLKTSVGKRPRILNYRSFGEGVKRKMFRRFSDGCLLGARAQSQYDTQRDDIVVDSQHFDPSCDKMVVSTVRVPEGVMVVSSLTTTSEAQDWETEIVKLDIEIVDTQSLEDLSRWKVQVDVLADCENLKLATPANGFTSATRVVSADDSSILMLTTFVLHYSNGTSHSVSRVFKLPVDLFPLDKSVHASVSSNMGKKVVKVQPLDASVQGTLLKHGLPQEPSRIMYLQLATAPLYCSAGLPNTAAVWPPVRSTALTVEAWIKLDVLDGPVVVYRHGSYSGSTEVYLDVSPCEGEIVWTCGVRSAGNAGCRARLSVGATPLGVWTHVAATIDEIECVCKLIVDGVQRTSSKRCTQILKIWSPSDCGPVIGTGLFGVVAHLKLWSVSRDYNTIRHGQHQCLRGDEPHLVAYWPMCDSCGVTLFDRGPYSLHAKQSLLSDTSLPDVSPARWVRCPDLVMMSRGRTSRSVIDTGLFERTSQGTLPHVTAYSNGMFMGVGGVPEGTGNWLFRFYNIETGRIEYEHTVKCQGFGFEPHAVHYDAAEHRLWAFGLAQLEIVIHNWSIPYFPRRVIHKRMAGYTTHELPANTEPILALHVVEHIMRAADLASLPLSQNSIPRLYHPLCVDVSQTTIESLFTLLEIGLDESDDFHKFLKGTALRLLRCNLESLIACEADPSLIGFAGEKKLHSGDNGVQLDGDIENKFWALLTAVFDRDPEDEDAKALLTPLLLLLLPEPGLRIVTCTSLALRYIQTTEGNESNMSVIETASYHILLTHFSKQPHVMSALRSPVPSLNSQSDSVSSLYLSNISFTLQSTALYSASQTFNSKPYNEKANLTYFVVTLLRNSASICVARLTSNEQCSEDETLIAVLGMFQKCLVALSVREAAATTVGPHGENHEYPPVFSQLVAYITELLACATRCLQAGIKCVDDSQDPGVWSTVDRMLRSSFLGVNVPVLISSLGLLIGTADTALLDIMDCMLDFHKTLQDFLQYLPAPSSRPSTGAEARPRVSLPSATDPLTPGFLQSRLLKRGGSHKRGGWDFWSDMQHSLLYIVGRISGQVASAALAPVPAPYERWFSSALMRSGLRSSSHQDMSRKARVVQGLLSGADTEMQMWGNLKKNHMQNKMLSVALQRAVDVDKVLRIVYAAVLHHAVPHADFTAHKSSQLPAGVLYGFSKIEGLVTQLMELKQTQGSAALERAGDRAMLLLRFDPGGHVLTARDIEMRMMLAPGVIDKFDSSQEKNTSAKVNNWKKLFLSWKTLRRLQQLLKLSHIQLETKRTGDADVAVQVVEIVADCTFNPAEVDALLKRRKVRGVERARGLEYLEKVIHACPEGACLLDCLVIAVKAISGNHYLHGLSASGSQVQVKVKNAIYSLVNYASSKLKEVSYSEADSVPVDLEKFLLQMFSVPWQASDMAFLLSSKLPQLLATLFSVLPRSLSEHSFTPETYVPDPASLDDAALPFCLLCSDVPVAATQAVLEQTPTSCITIAPNQLGVKCKPNCSSLRGTVEGSTLWSTKATSSPVFYYEVTIKELAELGAVAVGLGPLGHDRSRHPGWGPLSCAYHSDDGMLFQGNGRGKQLGPVFGAGQTVGCGMLTATCEVFWTLEGKLLPIRISNFVHDVKPLIGIDAKGEFNVNFGANKFMFDLASITSGTAKEKETLLRHVAWQLLHSLTIRASLIILLRTSGAQQVEQGTQATDTDTTAEGVVVFDQVVSPVNKSALRSPRSRPFDEKPPDQSNFLLAAVDVSEASSQLISTIVSIAVTEIARCVVLWDCAVIRTPLLTQIPRSCSIIAAAVYGLGSNQDPDNCAGEHLVACMISCSAPYCILRAASLQGMPRGISHMLLHTLSLALPGFHPSETSAAFVARSSPVHTSAIQDTLTLLMRSAGKCLPFVAPVSKELSSSGWGALRLLALLARSPAWHNTVATMLESSLEGNEGQDFFLISLAVVGGLREQLGTGCLVEYCSEVKAMKERAFVVALDLKDGTAQIVDRSLRTIEQVPLSAISLPDPFDWLRVREVVPNSSVAVGPEEEIRKDLWPILRELLRDVLNRDDKESAQTMMILRAAWINVKSSPCALKWLATSGLLKQIVAVAAQHNKGELPLEAAEEKVLMLYNALADLPPSPRPTSEMKDVVLLPIPLRYFATTHTHGSPLLSPSVVNRHAASETETEAETEHAEDVTGDDGGDVYQEDEAGSYGGEREEECEEEMEGFSEDRDRQEYEEEGSNGASNISSQESHESQPYQHDSDEERMDDQYCKEPQTAQAGLQFNGGLVSLGYPSRLSFSGSISIDLSLRTNSLQGLQTVLHRYSAGDDPVMAIQLSDDKLEAGWLVQDGLSIVASFKLPRQCVGKWMHVSAVYNESVWKLYKDGVLEATSLSFEARKIERACNWLIGGRAQDALGRFAGDLKNIRVWQVALCDSKVEQLSNGVLPVNNGTLVCFLRCKEREGRTVNDSTIWIDGSRICGELSGKVGWVASSTEAEIENEVDLTTLNDGAGAGVSSTTSHAVHACVDRPALWEELHTLGQEEMLVELNQAQLLVSCLYARVLLVQVIANWPDDVRMSVDDLGGTATVCSLQRVLVDSGQLAAAEIVQSQLLRMLSETPSSSNMMSDLLDESLALIEEVPSFIIRESTHPYVKVPKTGPCSVGIPGHTQYRVLIDPRSTEVGPEVLTIAADPECKRVIVRNAGIKPWPPLSINLPCFYYHYHTDSTSGGWGYKLIVQYGFERFELGLAFLEQLVNYCTTTAQPLPKPRQMFHALLSAVAHTQSYHRRLLLSVIRQVVSNPLDWPTYQIPNLGVLMPLKQALEAQYAREQVNGNCVLHSKIVQSLTELFLAVRSAESIWNNVLGNGDVSGEEFEEVEAKNFKVDHDCDGRRIVWAGAENLVVKANARLSTGKWYFEVKQLTGRGGLTIGIVSSKSSEDGKLRSWGWHTVYGVSSCGQVEHSVPRYNFPRYAVGVEVDLDIGTISFSMSRRWFASCKFSLHPDEAVFPAVMIESRDGVLINLGSAPFEYEQPQDYRSIRPLHLVLNEALPFNQLHALVDTSKCLINGYPLPPYFYDAIDHFKNIPHRVGPQYVELIVTDGVISNGLECKNSGTAFYSVKANVKVQQGKWYYEVTLASHGLMQIGWATDKYVPKAVGGLGVGDDEHSWAVDLFRCQKWHSSQPVALIPKRWAAGDVLGCKVNLSDSGLGVMSFTLNGESVLDEEGSHILFKIDSEDGIYPAASFRANNGCTFNFGGTPLKFLPRSYSALGVPDTWLERIDNFYNSSKQSWAEQQKEQTGWGVQVDKQIVSLVNSLCRAQRKNLHQVSLDRALSPDVWEHYPQLQSVSEEEIAKRVAVIKRFNRIIFTVVPLVNFEMSHRADSVASVLMGVRGLLFQNIADDIMRSIIKTTNGKAEPIRITLNRRKAARNRQFPDIDKTGQSSLYGQTYELLGSHPPSMFKTSQRFWSVIFAGEGAEDVGGPYREHITEMCTELMSSAVPLFIQSPNQRSGVGTHRDCYVINPSATLPIHIGMFEFLGRLMGGAIRSNEPLSLYLPPVIWKKIVGQPVGMSDLDCFDKLCYQCIDNFSSLSRNGVTEDMYNRTFSTETFSTHLSDGTVFELVHNGLNTTVPFERLEDYASLVVSARLNESDLQVQAIRNGLFGVIPEYIFHLTTWKDLELKVCGRPDFTVKELKEWTTLDGLRLGDTRVQFLWQVLEEITPSDRRAFLRFVAGRERLPVKLRIMPLFCKGYPDCYLPKAATCFFALELPDYSTVDVMREKLLYAIMNCSDIDTDFRAREIDEDEAPQVVFDEMRQEDQEVMEMDSESFGSGEEW